MTTPTSPDPDIAIIGGGIGGLATAAALRQFGIASTVYERDPSSEASGAGITLWANAGRALEFLGLLPEALRRGSRIKSMELRDPSGRVISRTGLAGFGGEPLCLPRGELIELLKSRIPPESIRQGFALQSLDETRDGFRLIFEDGRETRHEAVIGADGLHSRVRAWLHESQPPRYAGHVCWRGIAPLKTEPGMFFETWGGGRRFGMAPCGEGRAYWYATLNARAGFQPDDHRDKLLRLFRGWHAPVTMAIESTAEFLFHEIHDRQPLESWGRTACTLLGDAAHPTTPNLGQGGGLALEDAVVLARCLGTIPNYTVAFRRYEDRRRSRTSEVVNLSASLGRMAQLGFPGLWKLRNRMVAAMPSAGFTRRIKPLHCYDPATVII
jgi:2-polyprenyl-6-methoxyphenol hydroxylase-like FAD-dependent oxidoreductase